MDKNKEIINSIRDIFIEMNINTVYDDNINMYCDNTNKFWPKWITLIVVWDH